MCVGGGRKIAPLTLGVYLLHVHPLIWKYYMLDCVAKIVQDSPILMLVKIFILSTVIFSAGILVEWIRQGIFEKARINELCKNIDIKITRWLSI